MWGIQCAERDLSLVYDRLRTEPCEHYVFQLDKTTCQVSKDRCCSNAKSYMFVSRTSVRVGRK